MGIDNIYLINLGLLEKQKYSDIENLKSNMLENLKLSIA
mgnify:CR=1 FL=1